MAQESKSVLTEREIESRAVWCAKGVHVWREGLHLAIKGPGTPATMIAPEDLPRVIALAQLPKKPERCAHDKMPGDCPACGTVAGPLR